MCLPRSMTNVFAASAERHSEQRNENFKRFGARINRKLVNYAECSGGATLAGKTAAFFPSLVAHTASTTFDVSVPWRATDHAIPLLSDYKAEERRVPGEVQSQSTCMTNKSEKQKRWRGSFSVTLEFICVRMKGDTSHRSALLRTEEKGATHVAPWLLFACFLQNESREKRPTHPC